MHAGRLDSVSVSPAKSSTITQQAAIAIQTATTTSTIADSMSRHTLAVGQEVLNSLQISLRKLGHQTVVDTAFEQPVANID
jgi:hypothetical protein